MKWQPIESAPKDGSPLILFNAKWHMSRLMGGWDAHEGSWRLHGYGHPAEQPTHWHAPLPPIREFPQEYPNNYPQWAGAPKWANYVSMDDSGHFYWWEYHPKWYDQNGTWIKGGEGGRGDLAGSMKYAPGVWMRPPNGDGND